MLHTDTPAVQPADITDILDGLADILRRHPCRSTPAPPMTPHRLVNTVGADAIGRYAEQHRTALANRLTAPTTQPTTAPPIEAEPLPGTAEPGPVRQARPGPIARILSDAADILQLRGWAATGASCQRGPEGRLCLLGAIRVASGGTASGASSLTTTRAATFLLEHIQRHHAGAHTLPSWNDAQRSGTQPLAVLREAARQAQILGI